MPLDLQKTFSTNNTLTKTAFTCCYLPNILEPTVFDVVTIDAVLEAIKTELYKPLIDALPDSLADEKAYVLAKKRLPAWALNGDFFSRVTKAAL